MYAEAYAAMSAACPTLKFMFASYFGRYDSNLEFVLPLPIHGIHLDLCRAPEEFDTMLAKIGSKMILEVGVVNGRNIWKNNLAASVEMVKKAVAALGADRVIVSPSCSLLHSPHTLATEKKMDADIKSWMSFAVEKLTEVVTIAKVLSTD
jgi:5-methyltetrahydropteroyltriglutamate--homocysteine methyltransferase